MKKLFLSPLFLIPFFAQAHPLIPSQVKIDGKQLYHDYYSDSIHHFRDHILWPNSEGPKKIPSLRSPLSLSLLRWDGLFAGAQEESLFRAKVTRIKDVLDSPFLDRNYKERVLNSFVEKPFPLTLSDCQNGLCSEEHLLSSVLPAKVQRSDLFPIQCESLPCHGSNTLSEMDDSRLIAMTWTVKPNALSQQVKKNIGPYPYMVCFKEKECARLKESFPHLMVDSENTSLNIQNRRRLAADDHSLSFRHESLSHMDAVFIADLIHQDILSIQMIYQFKAIKNPDFKQQEEISRILSPSILAMEDPSSIQNKEWFTLGFQLGKDLKTLGLSTPFIQNSIIEHIFEKARHSPVLRANQRIRFLSEKTELAIRHPENPPEPASKILYLSVEVGHP